MKNFSFSVSTDHVTGLALLFVSHIYISHIVVPVVCISMNQSTRRHFKRILISLGLLNEENINTVGTS